MESTLQPIEPVTFARLMQLPPALRSDVLECASSTEISARQMERMIEDMLVNLVTRDAAVSSGTEVQ